MTENSLPFMKLMILNFCGHLSNKPFNFQSNYLLLHKPKGFKGPTWFNSEICHNLHQLRSLRKKLKRSNSPIISEKVTSAELSLQKQIIKAKSRYESNLVTNFALSNNSKIYSYIKSFSKHSDFPPTISFDSVQATNSADRAAVFNQFFHSKFNNKSPAPSTKDLYVTEEQLCTMHFLKWKFMKPYFQSILPKPLELMAFNQLYGGSQP